MDTKPEYLIDKAAYDPTGSKPKSKSLSKILILGLLCIVVLLVVLWFCRSQIQQSWSAITLPQELKGGIFVSSRGKTVVAYHVSTFGYEQLPYTAGTASAVTRSGTHFIIIDTSRNVPSTLEEDGAVRVESTRAMRSVSETPTTGIIAYALRSDSLSVDSHALPPDAPFTNPAQWDVYLRLANGTTTRIISGYAPQFLNDNTFIFFSSNGVYRYDLMSGEAHKVIDHRFTEVFGTPLISPDRTLVAFTDPVKKVTDVYTMKGTEPTLVMEIPEILISPALSNDALYALKATKRGGEVWKYALSKSKGTQIHIFPRSLGVGRIVF